MRSRGDLTPGFSAQVQAGHIFALVQEDAETCLSEALLQTEGELGAVTMVVGNEKIVAEHPIDRASDQPFLLYFPG
jgi:hypothetical protein